VQGYKGLLSIAVGLGIEANRSGIIPDECQETMPSARITDWLQKVTRRDRDDFKYHPQQEEILICLRLLGRVLLKLKERRGSFGLFEDGQRIGKYLLHPAVVVSACANRVF
jgi:hypothetical protein